jgi:hypothetical protein
VPEFKDTQHLSFREELHSIEAVIAGQGGGIFSDVLVADELAAGTLVKAFKVSLPGYSFYVIRRPGHPRERAIRAFSAGCSQLLNPKYAIAWDVGKPLGCFRRLMAPSSGWGMSAIPPLSGDKQTSGERAKNNASDHLRNPAMSAVDVVFKPN